MWCIVCILVTLVTADFAVIGDWGGHLGSKAQRRVAASLESRNPEFVISTGDNFYPDGIDHAIDDKISTLWSDIYNVTNRMWYSILGNHDYLKNASAQLHIDHPRWYMPSRYYDVSIGDTDLWFLDTTPWMKDNYVENRHAARGDVSEESRQDFLEQQNNVPEQIQWLRQSVAQSKAKKKYIIGHHPLWTCGYHRFADHTRLSDVILDLHEKHDLTAYLCGHDHSLQHIVRSGLHQFLSGAGSSSYEVFDGPGLQYKSTTDDHGFLMMYDNGTSAFIDGSNSVLYTSQ